MNRRIVHDDAFVQTFIREEERCGFLVSEMMKRVWATELEILATIDRICREYEIQYYAGWGTLLGAVRHGGFIPWDDDIDLCLMRKDYLRLINLLPDELPKEYVYRNHYNGAELDSPWAIIANGETLTVESRYEDIFYGCPYIVGIDLFPLDMVPSNEEEKEAQRLLYSIVYDATQNFQKYVLEGVVEEYLQKITSFTGVTIQRDGTEVCQLWRLLDQIASLYEDEECDFVTEFRELICNRSDYYLPKVDYDTSVRMPFENTTIPVPSGYDRILTMTYGKDYMIGKRNVSGGHGYPFFKEQEQFLMKHHRL